MSVRREAVEERLRKLREVVRNLESVRAVPREEFLSSFRHYWLAERGLQLAAEILFDVGNHLLAAHFNVHPTDYEDVIHLLAVQRVLPEELRERLRGLGGFRNVLVHDYLDVDEDRVYSHLQDGLGDFRDAAAAIERFLDGLSGP